MCNRRDRIKAITESVDAVRSALQSSEVVEVHPSEPKVRKRGFSLSSHEADRRTVYVEGFPMNADHDWLRNEFSKVGEVTLVSMPRHPKTRKFKGFAFVEFASVEDASRACQEYSKRAADGWLVVTKIEWIRTRKRYGRIREKCGRVAPRGSEGDDEQEAADEAEAKPAKRSAEEIEAPASERDGVRQQHDEQQQQERRQQEGAQAKPEEETRAKKRKKTKRDKTGSAAAPAPTA